MAQPFRSKHEITIRHQVDVFVTCAVLAAAATVLSSCQSGANSSAKRQTGKTASTSPAASQPEPGSFPWAVKNPDEFDAWAKAAEDEDRQRRAEKKKQTRSSVRSRRRRSVGMTALLWRVFLIAWRTMPPFRWCPQSRI